ncbi:MAG: prepilin-type N-terminal cleavage/methylation domain-containing protein [Betaproteobacteria bacterium]|nr:prepilin-type N-terminal cleavage/methylation domain-containing protein [Betaproteobacteria bacterium]
MNTAQPQKGFTLIEIAIVLVIIGLLLGGILKGQELITSARVRNLISQQDGIKAAFYGFQDRYRALPGDYQLASENLGGTGTITNGNGDGRIRDASTGGGTVDEQNLVWDHLTRAGFLNGNFVYAAGLPTDASTPKNPYGQFIQLIYDDKYYSIASTTPPARHNLKTGPQIPVEIAAEVDRKTDDGNAGSGSFVFSDFAGTGTGPTRASCASDTGVWVLQGSTDVNCGGTTLL